MLTGYQVSLDDATAVDLLNGIDLDRELEVRLRSFSSAFLVGDSSVTSTNGYQVPGGSGEFQIVLNGDTIWAIAPTSGTATVHVLVNVVK